MFSKIARIWMRFILSLMSATQNIQMCNDFAVSSKHIKKCYEARLPLQDCTVGHFEVCKCQNCLLFLDFWQNKKFNFAHLKSTKSPSVRISSSIGIKSCVQHVALTQNFAWNSMMIHQQWWGMSAMCAKNTTLKWLFQQKHFHRKSNLIVAKPRFLKKGQFFSRL